MKAEGGRRKAEGGRRKAEGGRRKAFSDEASFILHPSSFRLPNALPSKLFKCR